MSSSPADGVTDMVKQHLLFFRSWFRTCYVGDAVDLCTNSISGAVKQGTTRLDSFQKNTVHILYIRVCTVF